MTSFLYPRTIAIRRPRAQTGVGLASYGGQVVANETVVATGIRCSIQERREGVSNTAGLPGDAQQPSWYVFIPKSAAAFGLIHERDIVVDDLGTRYQVVAPYVDSLGYRLTVRTLET